MTTQTRTSTKRMPKEMPELTVWTSDAYHVTYKRGEGFNLYYLGRYTCTLDTIQECRQEGDRLALAQIQGRL